MNDVIFVLVLVAVVLFALYFVIRFAVLSAWRQIEHERTIAAHRAAKAAEAPTSSAVNVE